MISRGTFQLAPLALCLTLIVLLASCGGPASSVFTSAAPTDAIVPYSFGGAYAGTATVVALRGKDGATAWQTPIGARNNDAASVTRDGVLYIEATPAATTPALPPPASGYILALRLDDGKTLWRTPLPQLDYNVDLTADGATVIAAAGRGGLYALDPSNGTIRWHVAAPVAGPPLLLADAVVATEEDTSPPGDPIGIAAYRESDGALLWRKATAGLVVTNQLAVYNTDGDVTSAFAAQDGRILWTYQSGATADGGFPHPSQVVGASDQLVLVQVQFPDESKNYLAALDARMGTVAWKSSPGFDSIETIGAPLFGSSSSGQPIIYGSYKNQLVALRGTDGAPLWRIDLTPRYLAQVAFADGVLFAVIGPPSCSFICTGPNSPRLEALNAATGDTYWQRDLPVTVRLSEAR